MRIQHNIMAMNAYRNYNNNTSALSKNLEKLSSGYKINRAGDDAAGLAISEKMRSQITGLEAAQKNVKDGVSLVKTAEGAMQEVQDMLKRMKYLATQSANGTYQDEVDRENLQKEVESLKTEINRIADSANFNGQKLLDGSLAEGGAKVEKLGASAFTTEGTTTPLKEKDTVTLIPGTIAKGDKVTIEAKYTDGNNQVISKNFTFTVASNGTSYVLEDGTTKTDLATAIQEAMTQAGADKIFSFAGSAGTSFVAEALEEGGGKGQILQMNVAVNGNPRTKAAVITRTEVGTDEMNSYSGFAAFNGGNTKAEDYVFTVNGKKFAFATAGNSGKFASDVNVVTLTGAATPDATAVKEMMQTINRVLGSDVARIDETTDTQLNFLKGGGNGGLTLQIGDTADSYNQMKVIVGDMHTYGGMGIDGIDISTLEGAQAAIGVVTDATNYVSSIRGDLGAIQNRLEHTQNNLSVMAENIQDAESTIRDTDVAEEMMAYTKNNILVQSAQAMLAQANQVPQGVLQLLG